MRVSTLTHDSECGASKSAENPRIAGLSLVNVFAYIGMLHIREYVSAGLSRIKTYY